MSRILVNTQSDFNVNISVANANMLLEAYSSWMNLSKLEASSKKQELQVSFDHIKNMYPMLVFGASSVLSGIFL